MVNGKPSSQRAQEGLPLRLNLMSPQIGKVLLHPESVALITRVSEENDSHLISFDLFSATTKIDLAKSMPKYRWRGTMT